MNRKRIVLFAVPALFSMLGLALVLSCSESPSPTSPSIDVGPSGYQQPDPSTYGSDTLAVYPDAFQLSSCDIAQEVGVRFGSPGFIKGTRVGLYLNFTGMPSGDKKIRIFWDLDNRPGEYKDISVPDVDPFEEVIEHTYRDANVGDKRKVRAELIVKGNSGECARNRHIVLKEEIPTEVSSSPVSGSATLCDLTWGASGGCGIPSDPNTSYFFDFDAVQKVPAGDPQADLSKGHVDCCNWNPWNGATQVDTGVPSSQFDSVICGPGDGRTYAAIAIHFGQPNATVICLRTAGGRYVKYIGQANCCGNITIDYTAF